MSKPEKIRKVLVARGLVYHPMVCAWAPKHCESPLLFGLTFGTTKEAILRLNSSPIYFLLRVAGVPR